MRRILFLSALWLCLAQAISAQGLRYSVCIVEPEFSDTDKTLMSDYSLYMARAGMQSASHALGAYKNEGIYGSGVVITLDNKKYVLTNLHVVGYAKQATVVFQLHDKTVRYAHCAVTNIDTTDLAAIELPAESEMVALPLYDGDIDEDMAIVAAGFPELAGKPSWQLTRGIISNSHVDIDQERAIHIIQHTASIDPGSSGGPLLFKDAKGKYGIMGVNTWKALYREGVGLAIGKEDIQAFINTLSAPYERMEKAFEFLRSTSGEEWLYIFRHLPDSTQKSIKSMDWHLPLDQAIRVLAIRDSLIQSDSKNTKNFNMKASHIVTDMNHVKHVKLTYDNYLGINQQVGVQFGCDWLGYITTGVQISALIAEPMTENPDTGTKLGYNTRVGAMFGLYIGGQIPISVGQYILVPRITQSASAGPIKTGNIHGGYAIITDTRIGLDWRIPFGSCDMILGLHYDMNWLWTKDHLKQRSYKEAANYDSLNQYQQNGIGLTIGIGW